MRLVADAVTHHLCGVGDNDEGVRIAAADDRFQSGQFTKRQYRIEYLLFVLRISSLTAEDRDAGVNLTKEAAGDILPLGRDDKNRLPLAKTGDHEVNDPRGDVKVDEGVEGVLEGEQQRRSRQNRNVEGESCRSQADGKTLEEDH